MGITRILAIPGVIEWYRHYLSFLAPRAATRHREAPEGLTEAPHLFRGGALSSSIGRLGLCLPAVLAHCPGQREQQEHGGLRVQLDWWLVRGEP